MPKRLGHLMASIAALAVVLAMLRDTFGQMILLLTFAVAGGVGLALLVECSERWFRLRDSAWSELRYVLMPIALVAFLGLLIVLLVLFLAIAPLAVPRD